MSDPKPPSPGQDSLIRDSVAPIVSVEGGDEYGTAFAIHKDERGTYFLTCMHVIRDLGGVEKVRLSGKSVMLVAAGSTDETDLAVVRVEGPSSLPLKLSRFGSKDRGCTVSGFKRVTPKNYLYKRLQAQLGEEAPLMSGGGSGFTEAWEVNIHDDDRLEKGFSGGPVVHTQQQGVVGVISLREGDGTRGLAISVKMLEKIWPDMPPGLLKPQPPPTTESWRSRVFLIGLVTLLAAGIVYMLILSGSIVGSIVSVSATATTTATVTANPSRTSTATLTPSRTWTPSPAPPTTTPTPDLSATPSWTPTTTATATITSTPTRTPRPSATATVSRLGQFRYGVPVRGLAFSLDGMVMWVGAGTQPPRLVRLPDGEVTAALSGNFGAVRSLALSPDGRWVAAGFLDRTARLWLVEDSFLEATLSGHAGQVYDVAFAPDGARLATASGDGLVRLWSVPGGDLQATLDEHFEEVWSVAFSPDGRWLASASQDRTVRIWDAATGALEKTLGGQAFGFDVFYDVAFAPDGSLVAAASHDGTVRLWRTSDWGAAGFLKRQSVALRSVAFAPDGSLIAAGAEDGVMYLWRMSDRRLINNLRDHTQAVVSLAFAPAGDILASGSDDGTLRLWRVK